MMKCYQFLTQVSTGIFKSLLDYYINHGVESGVQAYKTYSTSTYTALISYNPTCVGIQ